MKGDAMNRRQLLRGLLNGAAIGVTLPILDCMLNGNGTAFADETPLPLRFGNWTWGLGMNAAAFVPRKTGPDFDLPHEIEMLAPIKKHINLFTNFDVFKDAAPNICHHTGWVILRSGMAPQTRATLPGETIDVTIAKKIGNATRYNNLIANATGDVRDSFSYANGSTVNPPHWSPVRLYQTLFGDGFQDPNAPEFRPDPRVMVRKSVLSAVLDDARTLMRDVGTSDRQRLDQYFTGLRDLERRLDLQMTKPDPIPTCSVADQPDDMPTGLDADLVSARHRIMTDLMLTAVACDQVRVFNMFYAAAFSATTRPGYDKPHHTATHEEPVDDELGYQPNVSWFTRRAMEEWLYFVQALENRKEGAGTMLDNVLVYASTDQSFAKIHAIDGIPMFTAGNAQGRVKTGLHIDGGGTQGTRLGYTVMKVFGLDIPSWGSQSNTTSSEIGEILA
ncbi:MAG: hypothetical protein Tsb0010_16250 [Parvularculaceae bacterium]